MERKTFILTQTKEFRRSVRLFLRDKEGKIDARRVKFTTEHKVSEKDRNVRARRIAAEFSTADEKVYDGLLRSTAYGKTFVLVGDPEAKLKREPFDITPIDAKKVALKNFFDEAGLKFDSTKSNEVLQEEYNLYISAKTGVKIGESTASEIPHVPVDVASDISKQVDEAREAYKAKYSEEIPDEFSNDKALLSALSDPDFDAKAYMEKASVKTEDVEEDIEVLRDKYFEQKGEKVPNPKKNNAAWIKSKLD